MTLDCQVETRDD